MEIATLTIVACLFLVALIGGGFAAAAVLSIALSRRTGAKHR